MPSVSLSRPPPPHAHDPTQGYQQLRRRNLRHLICTVAPVLDSLGATYWLDFGSLLGAQREKDVIAHDNDADVSRPRCLLTARGRID
jgi:hypothetical protein